MTYVKGRPFYLSLNLLVIIHCILKCNIKLIKMSHPWGFKCGLNSLNNGNAAYDYGNLYISN